MKICLYQCALIAAVICFTTAIYPKTNHQKDKNPTRTESHNNRIDTLNAVHDHLQLLQHGASILNAQHQVAKKLNHKDKNISAKRRNLIRKHQSQTTAAKRKIEKKTKELQTKINSIHATAIKAVSQTNQSVQDNIDDAATIPLQ